LAASSRQKTDSKKKIPNKQTEGKKRTIDQKNPCTSSAKKKQWTSSASEQEQGKRGE
jgi:hypothetical protein